MYYLEKDIETQSGAVANCWVMMDKKEILYRQQNLVDDDGNQLELINPTDYIQTGNVILIGYKDVASLLAGKLALSKPRVVSLGDLSFYKTVLLADLTEYVNLYDACQATVLNVVLATPEFTGAILKNTDDVS